MSVRKSVALACLVAALTVGLTGCDQDMSQGPAALKRAGAELIIAVCDDIEAESVLVETWASGNGTPTDTVFEGKGLATFQAGFEFSTDAQIEGLTAVSQMSPAMEPRDNFAVQILSANSSDGDMNATFTLGENGLSESHWLHPDGTETTEPCR